jgi:hypothetical protein
MAGKPPEIRKRSGARVVSGAVLEEGRGKSSKRLRGGGWSNSYDESVDKDKEGYDGEAVRKKKKKLRKCRSKPRDQGRC